MNFNTSDLIALAGVFLAAFTSLFGFIFWIINLARRTRDFERDFAHIKNNYAQMSLNLEHVAKEHDRRFDAIDLKLVEIESLMKH